MIDPARMDWPRLVPFAILAASIGALIIAYTAELAFGIEPCILCLYQRIPYALAGALAVAAPFPPGPWGPRLYQHRPTARGDQKVHSFVRRWTGDHFLGEGS